MVVNTYHLLLQPGMKLMRNAGGAHEFMGWDGPLLSDSGGYQVYSLIHKNAKPGRITEEGAEFRSVLDGSKHLLTPEKAIEIQFNLGGRFLSFARKTIENAHKHNHFFSRKKMSETSIFRNRCLKTITSSNGVCAIKKKI